jgi:hypothetical protein
MEPTGDLVLACVLQGFKRMKYLGVS